jgi:hypothetical protein
MAIAALQLLYTESRMPSGFFPKKSHLAHHLAVHVYWRTALSREKKSEACCPQLLLEYAVRLRILAMREKIAQGAHA